MKIDLSDCTFIIPICIESPDRAENAFINLSYLCKHLTTNILIYERGEPSHSKVNEILKCFDDRNMIDVIYEPGTGVFHRTRYLNYMLRMVQTPVTANLDIDVLLTPDQYLTCVKKVRKGVDLVYPYSFGNSQVRVNYQGRDKVKKALCLSSLEDGDYEMDRSEYGHCQFFNTESYREGGGEQEAFISWGHEDQERAYRFQKLGYTVEWAEGLVYHMEHTRGIDSSNQNPHIGRNNRVFDRIKQMDTEELRQFYGANKIQS